MSIMDNNIFTKDTPQNRSLEIILIKVADKTMSIDEAKFLITTIFQLQNNTVVVQKPFGIDQLDGGVVYKTDGPPVDYKL